MALCGTLSGHHAHAHATHTRTRLRATTRHPAGPYRSALISSWEASCKEKGIPASPSFSLQATLSTSVEVGGRPGGGHEGQLGGVGFAGLCQRL